MKESPTKVGKDDHLTHLLSPEANEMKIFQKGILIKLTEKKKKKGKKKEKGKKRKKKGKKDG